MTCQIVISDYLIERRMVYLLDDDDFSHYQSHINDTDALLLLFRDHAFFAGCTRWCELKLEHLHVLIINMLKISAKHSNAEVANKKHATIVRLSFLFCALVRRIEDATGSSIDLLRVARIGPEDVAYDYCARLDVQISSKPKTQLRVVIDNRVNEE